MKTHLGRHYLSRQIEIVVLSLAVTACYKAMRKEMNQLFSHERLDAGFSIGLSSFAHSLK